MVAAVRIIGAVAVMPAMVMVVVSVLLSLLLLMMSATRGFCCCFRHEKPATDTIHVFGCE